MKVRLDYDYCPVYFLSECTGYGDIVDIEDHLWERFRKYEIEQEFWQNKLFQMDSENRTHKLLENSRTKGIESLG